MGLSQELTCQPAVAKKSLPPKPKKDQANMMLDLRNFPKKPESTMDTSSSHDTLLDTPTMDQADFNWSSLQDESHLNSVPDFQEEPEWNNNEEIHSQMFGGSLELEPHPYQEPEQMDVTVQPKQELHDMTCVAPALVEGIALPTAESNFQPKPEPPEVVLNCVVNSNNMCLEILNPEETDAVQSALLESGIHNLNWDEELNWESFCPNFDVPSSPQPTTETFVDGTDLANLLLGEDDPNDPTWKPEQETPTTSRATSSRPTTSREFRSVQKASMKPKKPGRPERDGPYQIPTMPSRNVMNRMTDEEIQGLKYRRMRELNNQASKACRAKRKNKQQALEEELVVEKERNLRLRQKLDSMEKEYEKLNSQRY